MAQRTVVVTGASTGIGRATVVELVSAGYQVFATVRRDADAESLRQQFPELVTPVIMDLLDEDSVRAAGEVINSAGPLYGLVNNAGAALPGPLETMPIEVFRRQIEINLTAQLLVTQVMLPALHRSAEQIGDARIIMIGSIGGRLSGPILGGYGAAKHGLVGLSSSLRAELAPFNIKVLLIEPGAIATPIWDRGQAAGDELQSRDSGANARYADQIEAATKMAKRLGQSGPDPSVPAKIILHALQNKNPPPRQVVGREAKVVAAMVRVLPFRTFIGSPEHDDAEHRSVARHSRGMHRAVAEGVFVQVLLVVVLGVVEVGGRGDLGSDPPVTRTSELGLELIPHSLGSFQLLRRGRDNRRSVLGADVVALPHPLGRVMVLKEDLEQLLVADHGRVVAHFHDLGVPGTSAADLLVRRIRGEATRISDGGVGDSRRVPEQFLGAPEATESEVGNLRTFGHLLHGNAKDVMESWIDQDRCGSAFECLIGLDQVGLRP
jgi:NAD(P)-dependent dehydrogenase (short-subunit alcohol dehydrogenase family)